MRDADGTFPYALMDAHAGLKELVTQSAARGRTGAGRTLEGSRAVLQGLSRADLNGATVSVGAYDAEADRYSITLPSSAVVAIKRINVVAESAQAAAVVSAGALKPPRCGICDVRDLSSSNKIDTPNPFSPCHILRSRRRLSVVAALA